jgi:hypothetical protein
MKWSLSVVVLSPVLTLLLFNIPAFGQVANPCAGDLEKYCNYVETGGGRLVQCYEQNKNKMSAGCIAWAEAAKANATAVKAACADVIDESCSFEKGDPLEMLDCLQSNYVDLSPKCMQKLNEFKSLYPQPAQ